MDPAVSTPELEHRGAEKDMTKEGKEGGADAIGEEQRRETDKEARRRRRREMYMRLDKEKKELAQLKKKRRTL